jgi:hypothetical protein
MLLVDSGSPVAGWKYYCSLDKVRCSNRHATERKVRTISGIILADRNGNAVRPCTKQNHSAHMRKQHANEVIRTTRS